MGSTQDFFWHRSESRALREQLIPEGESQHFGFSLVCCRNLHYSEGVGGIGFFFGAKLDCMNITW